MPVLWVWPPMKMSEADAGMQTARALLEAGETTAAIEQLRRVLDTDPGRLEALILLGHTFIRTGLFEQARVMLERAHTVAPDNVDVLHALGGACHQVGLYDRAQACLEKATDRMPRDPRLWYSLGLVRHAAGYYQAAIEAYDHALQIEPANANALSGKGKVLQILGELGRARESFNAALESNPRCVPARVGLATSLEMEGRDEDAAAMLTPVLDAMPGSPELALLWGRLLASDNRSAEARVVIETLLNQPLADSDRSHACFALGDLHDAQAQYGEAARCYVAGNRSRAGVFDRSRHERRVSGTVAAWSTSVMTDIGTVNSSDRPIFIVGMPRSGTSLVEQILGRHPEVHAAGELTKITDLAGSWQREDGVVYPADLDRDRLGSAADDYLRVSAGASNALRVTDKMPSNYLYLGLIQALFGNARVVHCRRNAADNALSCFCQDFSALGLAWSSDMEDIAAYYRGYRQLMSHWQTVLNISILEIDYERLVKNPQAETKRLLAFAGLPWDPACLDPGEDNRVVATASNKQVRQEIYQTSVGRADNYRAYLEFPADVEFSPRG